MQLFDQINEKSRIYDETIDKYNAEVSLYLQLISSHQNDFQVLIIIISY